MEIIFGQCCELWVQVRFSVLCTAVCLMKYKHLIYYSYEHPLKKKKKKYRTVFKEI